MLLQPGSLTPDGKYRVDAFVGKGATAEVYRATHISLKTRRAIKVLHHALEGAGVGSTTFDNFRQRFKLEAQLGGQFNQANIIHVYDFIEQGDKTLMLVMEYAPGGSLSERLTRLREGGTVMPIEEATGIALDIATGLTGLHARDVVHRDLKPSNILFDEAGRAKVADLGLAQIPGGPSLRSQLSAAQPHPGTPAYMSPEQTNSLAYLNSSSDVYAVGLILFEMLTGRAYKNMRPGTRASALRQGIPVALDELLAQMLNTPPEARPFDGAEVADRLRATGIVPQWNRDDAWQREKLAATVSIEVPKPAPPRVQSPAPAPTPVVVPRPIQTTPPADVRSAQAEPARPAGNSKRSTWILPAIGLTSLVAIAVVVVASLPQPAPFAPAVEPTQTTAPIATQPPQATAVPTAPAQVATVTDIATIAPAPTPPIPTQARVVINIAGAWQTNFATLQLNQNGTDVTGTYERYGYSEALSIQGTLDGNRLSGLYKGDPALVFEFDLNADGQRFDGSWSDKSGNKYQWCGVRSGPLPNGCGFSGKWFSIGDYKVNYDPTIELVQTGRAVRGTFLNGVETSEGTVEGTIGVDGAGSQYTVSGQWAITKYKGPLRWVLVDYARDGLGQFQGRSVTADGKAHQWCGWRAGSSRPSQCMDK